MLFALPILGGERCVKDEMECTAHPPWINRWKDHAKSGMLVFKEMLDKVRTISLLTRTTMRIHDPTLAKENRPVPRWAFHVYGNYKAVLESVVGIVEDEEKNKANGWKRVTEHETRSLVKWECDCKWHLPMDYVGRYNLMMPSNMWQQVWQILCEGIGNLEAEEKALREMVKKAVVQQDREFEEAERKRKRIAELEAASRKSPVSTLDAAMIAQIAEQVRANLSITDLERMLNERKASEQSRSSQDVMMDERTSELKEMRDAAKERRSQLIKGDAKKEDAVEETVEEKKDDVEGEDMD